MLLFKPLTLCVGEHLHVRGVLVGTREFQRVRHALHTLASLKTPPGFDEHLLSLRIVSMKKRCSTRGCDLAAGNGLSGKRRDLLGFSLREHLIHDRAVLCLLFLAGKSPDLIRLYAECLGCLGDLFLGRLGHVVWTPFEVALSDVRLSRREPRLWSKTRGCASRHRELPARCPAAARSPQRAALHAR